MWVCMMQNCIQDSSWILLDLLSTIEADKFFAKKYEIDASKM